MQPFILISIIVFALIVIGILIVAAVSLRRANTETDFADKEMHPQGYWIGLGMSIGAGFGVALGLVFDNLALGIAMGAGFGVAIGSALEQKNRNKIRPLTEQEQNIRLWSIVLGVVALLGGVAAFILLYLKY